MTAITTGPFKKRRRIVGGDLRGWDAIADALDVSVKTAQRYEIDEPPLPVHRHKGRVFAYACEVQDWHKATTEAA